MSRLDDASVRFSCPRCFLRLKAPLVQVGTRRRCPRCHWTFEVPTPAQAARRRRKPGEYRIREHMGPLPAESQPRIVVICPVCSTVIHAAQDQVGQQVTCPDCSTQSVVPQPVQVEKKATPPAVDLEQYALSDEVDPAAVDRRPAEQTYVPVTCPTCKTFLQVTEDQVGRQIVCPDCRVPMVVPPQAESTKKKRTPEADYGEYALRDDQEDSACDVPAAAQARYPVHCPLCDALIYVEPHQARGEIMCRDCETSFVVPPPPAPKGKPDLRADADDVYGVGAAIEVPEYKPRVPTPRQTSRPGLEPAADAGTPVERAETRPPPRWTFFSGIFGFPAYRGSWSRWVGLSLGLTMPLLMGQLAFSFAAGGGVGLFVAMGLTSLASVFGVIWAIITFVYCLAILRDTADGYHQMENWPDAVFLDWLDEFLFLLTSLAVAVLPGMGISYVLQLVGVATWPVPLVTLLTLFPISLMAMLERNSPLDPLSAPVWRSLIYAWWGWALFYLETTLLIAAVGSLVLLSAVYVPVVGLVLTTPLLVALLMIYFRLLGRLAWHCAQLAPADEPLDDEEPEDP